MNSSQNKTEFQTNTELRAQEKTIVSSEEGGAKSAKVSNLTVGVATGVLGGVTGVAASKLIIDDNTGNTPRSNDADIEPIHKNDDDQSPIGIKESLVVTSDMSFNEAFAAARNDVGPGGVFYYKGHCFGTYLKGEWESLPPDIRLELNKYDLKSNVPPLADSPSNNHTTTTGTVVSEGEDVEEVDEDEDLLADLDESEEASYDELDNELASVSESEFAIDKNVWLVDDNAISEAIPNAEMPIEPINVDGNLLADVDVDVDEDDEDDVDEDELSDEDPIEAQEGNAVTPTTPVFTDADHLNKLYADISAAIDPNAVYSDEDHLKSLQAELSSNVAMPMPNQAEVYAPIAETTYSDADHLESLQAELYAPIVETTYSDVDHLESLQAEVYAPVVETYSDADHLESLQAEVYAPIVEPTYSDADHLESLQAEVYAPVVETYSDADHLESLQAEMDTDIIHQ